MQKRVFFGICAWLVLLLAPIGVSAEDSSNSSTSYTPADVPDSVVGFQSQVDELIRVGKTHDQSTWRIALDTFALPNADQWLARNFFDKDVAQMTQDYTKVKDGHLGHISWVLGQYVDLPGFSIRVDPSEMPAPPASVGFESLIPRPLYEVDLHNFRLTASSTSKSDIPSWVSSFIYFNGHFRVVGGTYPFWAEKLTPFRGPMTLPIVNVRGMTVQGMAYRHDEKGNRILGVVQLHIDVGHDGHVKKIKVLSGDAPFVQDAKNYIQSSQFSPLPDDPRLANVKIEWDFEVAFFSTNN